MATILAIDDKQDNLITITALLRNFIPGCTVITADSGPGGIEQARQKKPDTILLDIKMPGMDGFEVCNILKQDPVTSFIPIILVTAINGDSKNRIKGLENGADAFLSKPIDQAELIAQVHAMLRIKQAEDKLRLENEQISGLYEQLFNGSINSVIVYDREGRIIMINEAGAGYLGYTVEEVIGRLMAEFIPEIHDRLITRIRLTLQEQKTYFYEETLDVGGRQKWFWSSYSALPQQNSLKGLVQVISHDISERKKSEEQQLRLQRNLESLWELAKKTSHSLEALSDDVLHQITRLTESLHGFYGFVDMDRGIFTLHAYSNLVQHDCSIVNKPLVYNINQAGSWATPLLTGTPLIINDYEGTNSPAKLGLPQGHVKIKNFISIPVFEGDKIVALGAVANKAGDYTDDDVQQISAYMQNAQIIIKRRQYEEMLQHSLHEKEILIKEIHHRVKNNLQNISALINIKKMSISNPDSIAILEETSERVYSIGLAHELLYQSEDLSSINFKDYITEITSYLSRVHTDIKRNIRLDITCDLVLIDINRAVPLALLLNELVNNCYKHAFNDRLEGTISIRFSKEPDRYKLLIQDNGRGLPEDYDTKKTIGVMLVNQLTKQLLGENSFYSQDGTIFQLIFPQ